MALLIPKENALGNLGALINSMPRHRTADDNTFVGWRQRAVIVLGTLWGDDSAPVRELKKIRWSADIKYGGESDHEKQRRQGLAYNRGFEQAEQLLQSLVQRVVSIPDPPQPPPPAPAPAPNPAPEQVTMSERTNRVFIVHGHDEALRQGVARYIQCLGLVPVTLMEEPNRGRTVIEKFEEESEADFAVVLATGDDMAATVKKLKAVKSEEVADVLDIRARQNVVFELGYFVGKLGRGAVMLVTDPKLDIPSDLAGVVYTLRHEVGGRLWHELEAAGFEFTKEQIKAATKMVI